MGAARGDRLALERALHALNLFRALGRPAREADALNTVGWFAACLGGNDIARSHCQAALTLHRRHHNLDGEAATLDSLGWIGHHTGQGPDLLRFGQVYAVLAILSPGGWSELF